MQLKKLKVCFNANFQGLQVGKMELVSPWDVIEGYKNPPPLSWTYFGAVRIEKRPLKYEEQHRYLNTLLSDFSI